MNKKSLLFSFGLFKYFRRRFIVISFSGYHLLYRFEFVFGYETLGEKRKNLVIFAKRTPAPSFMLPKKKR